METSVVWNELLIRDTFSTFCMFWILSAYTHDLIYLFKKSFVDDLWHRIETILRGWSYGKIAPAGRDGTIWRDPGWPNVFLKSNIYISCKSNPEEPRWEYFLCWDPA